VVQALAKLLGVGSPSGAVGSVLVAVDSPVLDAHPSFEEVVELPVVDELVAQRGAAQPWRAIGLTPRVGKDRCWRVRMAS